MKSVSRVLSAVPGVADLDGSPDRGKARFKYDLSKADQVKFRCAIEDAGFEVK